MRQISHSKFTEILVQVRKHSAEFLAVRRVAMVCDQTQSVEVSRRGLLGIRNAEALESRVCDM